MKLHSQFAGMLAAGCALSLAVPAYAVDDEEFKTFKDAINKRLEQLEKSHEQDLRTIQENQKVHQQDQQEIQRLKQQLDETQKTATDAQQKADAASQTAATIEGPAATHNFMVVGDAEVQFGKVDSFHSGFVLADFAPIFLFRARDNILFEAGFDVTLQNGNNGATPGHDAGSSTGVDLSFATLDYALNDYVTVVAGDMLLPLGTYSERSAGWLNKIPDDPLPRMLVPGSGVGAQLRGALPIGPSGQALTYAAYGVNGPSSMDGSGSFDQLDLGGNVGVLNSGNTGNLHGNPSGGGRLGWFVPIGKAHYDLELGLSGQSGTWDDADSRQWSSAVLDGALHLGRSIEIKGEYIYSWVQTSDLGMVKPRGWWIQAGYMLSGLNLDLPLINNIELVGRYDKNRDFLDGALFTKADRYTVGYVYYVTNTLLFEGDYEFASSDDPGLDHNRLVFQLSFGF